MACVSWEYAALYYLNWWLRHDSRYRSALRAADPDKQQWAVQQAAVRYGVARNLPTRCDKERGLERLEPVREVLMDVPACKVNRTNVAAVVSDFSQRVSAKYDRADVLSLATKFLWLRFRSPVLVYDRNVSASLGYKGRDFAEYSRIWRAEYERVAERVNNACVRLPELSDFCFDPSATSGSVAAIAGKRWFKERVFDVCHWHGYI